MLKTLDIENIAVIERRVLTFQADLMSLQVKQAQVNQLLLILLTLFLVRERQRN